MRCRYCDSTAVVTPEHGGVRVGLCRRHVRECVQALEDAPSLAALHDHVASAD